MSCTAQLSPLFACVDAMHAQTFELRSTMSDMHAAGKRSCDVHVYRQLTGDVTNDGLHARAGHKHADRARSRAAYLLADLAALYKNG